MNWYETSKLTAGLSANDIGFQSGARGWGYGGIRTGFGVGVAQNFSAGVLEKHIYRNEVNLQRTPLT